MKKKTKNPLSSLSKRVLSAVVLLPFVLWALYAGGDAFLALAAIVAGLAMLEWVRLVSPKKKSRAVDILSIFAVVAGVVLAGNVGMAQAEAFILVFSFIVGLSAVLLKNKKSAFRLGFGVAYVGIAMAGIAWLRQFDYGFEATLFLALVVWSGDVFAYFSGRAIGGAKLAPKISPNKTWAGLFGGAIGSGIVAVITVASFPYIQTPNIATLAIIGAVGFIMTLIGQGGDLFISVLKRHYGVKDTGTLIPGHGGVLDRIDALLLVGLVFVPFYSLFTPS